MSTSISVQEIKNNLELLSFVDILCKAMLGVSVDMIPYEKKEIINECLNVFELSISSYILQKYGKKDYTQLKSIGFYPNTDFSRFPGLEQKFDEAYDNFLNTYKQK